MRIPAAVVRWVVSASIAGSVTAVLFLTMTRLVSGEWLYEGLLRIFPLGHDVSDVECSDTGAATTPVTIEGELGYFDAGRFVSIPDGELLEGTGSAATPLGRTSESGGFAVVLGFAAEAPASCPDPETRTPPAPRSHTLTLRAPGCAERRVPITPAWVPHRVILECRGRGSAS